MSRNHPGTEVDPSEGSLEDASGVGEAAGNQAEEQVDPSEDKE
jgi:hypothetical protein